MKKSARPHSTKGFTLIELFISLAIIGLMAALGTTYLFGSREKNSLQTERDRIINTLKIAQQKAMAAQQGYDYTVSFQSDSYRLETSAGPLTTHELSEGTTISSVSPSTITFSRLTGKTHLPLELTLSSRRFECQISVDPQGVIESTNPERKK